MAGVLAQSDDTLIRDAIREFHMFTLTHGLMLGAFIVVSIMILRMGLARRDTPRQRPYERALGLGGVILWCVANGYGFLPGVLDWRYALPIGVCDSVALIGPIVLLLAQPPMWMRAWLYFVGLGLCTQAFITPTLREGPTDPQFWFFWGGHFVILIAALYDLVVRRWRPTWRAWRIALALSAAYLVVIFPINLLGGWNYAFVGREMRAGTLIEVLGPWPGRVAIIVGLVVLAYTGMMLPWAWVGIRRKPSQQQHRIDGN